MGQFLTRREGTWDNLRSSKVLVSVILHNWALNKLDFKLHCLSYLFSLILWERRVLTLQIYGAMWTTEKSLKNGLKWLLKEGYSYGSWNMVATMLGGAVNSHAFCVWPWIWTEPGSGANQALLGCPLLTWPHCQSVRHVPKTSRLGQLLSEQRERSTCSNMLYGQQYSLNKIIL